MLDNSSTVRPPVSQVAQCSCGHKPLTYEESSTRGCVAPSPLYTRRNIANTSELSAGALPRRVLERNMSPNTTNSATTKEYKPRCLQVGEAKSEHPSSGCNAVDCCRAYRSCAHMRRCLALDALDAMVERINYRSGARNPTEKASFLSDCWRRTEQFVIFSRSSHRCQSLYREANQKAFT